MDTNNIKFINIREFREKGYLQELNRNFLHPLGLALSIKIDDDGNECLGGIWDYRNDKGGIYYNLSESNKDRIEKFEKNRIFIENEFEKRKEKRIEVLGSIIEKIK
ncbi:MAG: hypothetical protein ACOC1K_00470 [Nanoarchaeota archaeon]